MDSVLFRAAASPGHVAGFQICALFSKKDFVLKSLWMRRSHVGSPSVHPGCMFPTAVAQSHVTARG